MALGNGWLISENKIWKVRQVHEVGYVQLKKQSEHLLEVAKRAVEIAIEQDEAAAIAWIAGQTERTAK